MSTMRGMLDEVRDVAAGLWLWRVRHPAWGPGLEWEPLVTATCVESNGEVALLDPIAPPDDIPEIDLKPIDPSRRFLASSLPYTTVGLPATGRGAFRASGLTLLPGRAADAATERCSTAGNVKAPSEL